MVIFLGVNFKLFLGMKVANDRTDVNQTNHRHLVSGMLYVDHYNIAFSFADVQTIQTNRLARRQT
jgi:hypothetical protein